MTMRVWGLATLSVVVVALTAVAVIGEIAVSAGAGSLRLAAAVALAMVGGSWYAVGVFLALRRPRHPLGWLFVGVGAGTQAGVAGEVADRAGWFAWSTAPVGVTVDVLAGLGLFLLVGLLPVLYPSGRIAGRAAVIVTALTATGAVLAQAQVLRARIDPAHTWLFGPPVSADEPSWILWLPWVVYFGGALGGWILCAARLVRATHPLRQQLAWLLIAVVSVLVTQLLGDSPIAMALQAVALVLLPVAIAVGIARYQLLDIDTAVPRAITAGVLGVLVAAVYLAAAAILGAGITGATMPSVLAAAVVAALLLPLHARVRRIVDRFVYGTRADPVRAVAELGAAVAAVPGGDMLQSLLVELARAFRARGARIRTLQGAIVAQTGESDAATALVAELAVAGEPVATVELFASRSGGYSSTDRAMLGAMAGTLALAVRAVTLADELEDQRDAVMEASAVARDRLRRDMHDGLGPSLTGLRLGLQALADAHDARDHDRAVAIADVLRDESERAVAEVRRLIDDLRPIDLDDADLVAALRRRLARAGTPVPVTVEAAGLPSLPRRVEDGVYRIVSEAVANAHKHASAHAVRVELRAHGAGITARVSDDGVGIAADAPAGIGLASMRARAAELGGRLDVRSSPEGTSVTLTVPRLADLETIDAATAGPAS